MNNIRIGVLDTAVDYSMKTVENMNLIIPDYNKNRLTHGAICYLVLRKNTDLPISVEISVLSDTGIGYTNSIYAALGKCIEKNIWIINMSLGTTHFLDKAYIKKTINHYANKGLIIIAASSNDGFTTYPASLSNVISVACGDDFCVDENLQMQKGIDFIAPSEHEITIEGASFRLGKSNSYAAPYVTAMVGNLISEKGMMTVNEIRNALAPRSEQFIYYPDWIENAWVSPDCRRSKAGFYFEEDTRKLQECIDEVDTLVLCSPDDIKGYADAGKNIVYLGSDDNTVTPDIKYHFWSGKMRRKQVLTSLCKDGDINIPVICCIFEEAIDQIYCLCELKKLFANDGYNAYTGCGMIEAPLYDVEFLPTAL